MSRPPATMLRRDDRDDTTRGNQSRGAVDRVLQQRPFSIQGAQLLRCFNALGGQQQRPKVSTGLHRFIPARSRYRFCGSLHGRRDRRDIEQVAKVCWRCGGFRYMRGPGKPTTTRRAVRYHESGATGYVCRWHRRRPKTTAPLKWLRNSGENGPRIAASPVRVER